MSEQKDALLEALGFENVTRLFVDYWPCKECKQDFYGMCIKCEECGRKFDEAGFLMNSDEYPPKEGG